MAKEALTPRQKQSRKIMREKESKKRREEFRRRMQFACGMLLGVIVVGGSGAFYYSGMLAKTTKAVTDGFYGVTIRAGLAVRSLHIEGRNRTSMKEILDALEVKKGAAILRFSLDDMRDRLQKIPSVKEAAVERALPDGLYVRIIEREPVALWQNQGKLSLVDDNGVVMNDLDLSTHKDLPLIVGEGAPAHVMELMNILASEPELAKDFASAIRVGDRRWNIRLKNELEIKLPEEAPETAWRKLAKLQEDEKILERDVKVIDLRVPDRTFMKLSPTLMAPSANAKET
jgi:cell division protein FtsQ